MSQKTGILLLHHSYIIQFCCYLFQKSLFISIVLLTLNKQKEKINLTAVNFRSKNDQINFMSLYSATCIV